jgi:PAS domain S-box-containing protein
VIDAPDLARVLIDTCSAAYVEVDAEERIAEWSDKAERMFGWTRAEALGRLAPLTIAARHRAEYAAGLRRLRTDRDQIPGERFETTALHCDGHEFVIEVAATRTARGGDVHFVASVRDVTAVHRAKRQRAEKEGRYRDVVDRIEEGYFEVGLDGVYCTRIRSDNNDWPQVEAYISQHLSAFSHGICPECFSNGRAEEEK